MSETHESPSLRVRLIGLPIDAQQEERVQSGLNEAVLEHRARVMEEQVKAHRPADLTPEEIQLLRQAETHIRDALVKKMEQLGLPSARIGELPAVSYVSSPIRVKGKPTAEGAVFAAFGFPMVHIDRTKDLLRASITAAHELSHAATKREIWTYWNDRKESKPTITKAVVKLGAETVANKEILGGAIENGLAILDSMDTYYATLKSLFLKETHEMNEALSSQHIQQQLTRLDRSVFGPADRSRMEPFLAFYTIPFAGTHPMLEERFWQNARLVEELCHTIAYAKRGTVNEGRAILDKDRFTGSHDGLREIVRIFGQKDALTLLRLKDDGKHLDRAMKLIRAKQHELGMS